MRGARRFFRALPFSRCEIDSPLFVILSEAKNLSLFFVVQAIKRKRDSSLRSE
jgi:hypothetical protein